MQRRHSADPSRLGWPTRQGGGGPAGLECRCDYPPPSPRIGEIDPGAAAGAIRLGDRREAVHQLLGKPTWAYGPRSKRVEVFRKRPPTTPPTHFRIVFHGEIVEQILVGYLGTWVFHLNIVE